jgi:predicted RNase H-like HicB family nuclease
VTRRNHHGERTDCGAADELQRATEGVTEGEAEEAGGGAVEEGHEGLLAGRRQGIIKWRQAFQGRRCSMKTHLFRVEIEEDDDGRWAAICPVLPGCATWGHTQEEALRNIQEAVAAYVADLVAVGETIPPADTAIDAPAVSVVTA